MKSVISSKRRPRGSCEDNTTETRGKFQETPRQIQWFDFRYNSISLLKRVRMILSNLLIPEFSQFSGLGNSALFTGDRRWSSRLKNLNDAGRRRDWERQEEIHVYGTEIGGNSPKRFLYLDAMIPCVGVCATESPPFKIKYVDVRGNALVKAGASHAAKGTCITECLSSSAKVDFSVAFKRS